MKHYFQPRNVYLSCPFCLAAKVIGLDHAKSIELKCCSKQVTAYIEELKTEQVTITYSIPQEEYKKIPLDNLRHLYNL